MKEFLFLIWISAVFSQSSFEYKGLIVDAESGEPLVGVNVYRDGTIEGTASDVDGRFHFVSTVKNPKVTISYVGFQSQTRILKDQIRIKLKADVYSGPIVVVTATGLTRAQQIIVNTIENYQEAFKKVQDFETEVYSKVFLYFPKTKKDSLKDDSLRAIGKADEIGTREPWVFESYKRVNWERPDKISQIILKRNQGKAVPAIFNIIGVIYYQNAFNTEFMDQNSPMNNDHFWDFDYSYRGKVLHEGDSSYVIMATRTDTTHFLQYKMLIGDEKYDLKRIEVAQKPSSTESVPLQISPFIRMRNSKNVTVMQDYKQENGLTIPINYTITRINERGIIRMSELYQHFKVNSSEHDVAFTEKQFILAHDVDEISDTLWTNLRPQPLNRLEKRAYIASDSIYYTYTPWERFMFDYGFDVLFFNYYLGDYKLTGMGDLYHYSPVEGHVFGIGLEAPPSDVYRWEFNAGYAEAMEKVVGQVNLEFPVSYGLDLRGIATAYHKIRPLSTLTSFSPTMETFTALFTHENDFNYLLLRGFNLDLRRQITNELTYGTIYRHQEYIGLDNISNFSIINPNDVYKPNIRVENTNEHELGLYLKYDESVFFDLPPFKMRRRKENAWQVDAELTFNANNSSALSFKRFTANIYKQNDLTRFTQLNFNSDIYYVGEEVSVSHMFFPRTPNAYDRKVDFSLAGFGNTTGTFDYASLGTSLIVRRFFEPIGLRRLGTIGVFGQAFVMDNHGVESLVNVNLLKTDIDFNYGVSIENSLLFVPLRLVWMYNTKLETSELRLTFGATFN
jgi:hypothetical protein